MWSATQMDVFLIYFLLLEWFSISGRVQTDTGFLNWKRIQAHPSTSICSCSNHKLEHTLLEVRAERPEWSSFPAAGLLHAINRSAISENTRVGGWDRARRLPQIASVGQLGTACLCDVSKKGPGKIADHTPVLLRIVTPQASIELCQRLYWVTKKARGRSQCNVFQESSSQPPLQPPLSLGMLAKQISDVENRIKWEPVPR